ncbi:reverse transcriptase domain-containing protein [Tanacetum coccineum]
MANSILNEAQANQYLTTESNVKCELSKELLTELQINTYSGRVEEDAFPLSLSGDARKWWMNERDGRITTWEELVKKFFRKFYPISCASNYDKMCDDEDEGRNPLEFIPWMNSKFKDHKKVDETTKCVLLYTWIEVGNEEGLMDEVSSDEE